MIYSNWDLPTAHQTALSLLKRDAAQRPTAVCCVCDHIAMILISAAGQLGLRVPQDLTVTGFDVLSVASIYNPPLTTICQPFEEIGRVAVRRLLELRDKSKELNALEESLPTRLVVRGSTVVKKEMC